MLVYKIVSLIFWLLVIPFCMGLIILPLLNKRHRTPGVALLGGYILQFTLLEIVGIPVVLLAVYNGFTTFIKWYTPFLVLFALAGIWVTYLKMRKGYELNFKELFNGMEATGESLAFWILFLALLGFQLYMAFTRASFDGDDAYYGVQALVAQQIDSLYRVNPYTGRSSPLDVRHALALFPIWEAYVGSMSGVHVTIICHSVMPMVLIPLTYMLYYQVGRALFKRKRERASRQAQLLFMVLIALWQMFGAVSIYTTETFFLTRTWQGKSFAGNFVIPAVLWIFLCLFEKVRLGESKSRELRLKEGWSITEKGKSIIKEKKDGRCGQTGFWILLACLNLAGGASSSLAILLSCLMTAGLGFLCAIRERQIGFLVKAALTCLPGGVYVLLYVALTQGWIM